MSTVGSELHHLSRMAKRFGADHTEMIVSPENYQSHHDRYLWICANGSRGPLRPGFEAMKQGSGDVFLEEYARQQSVERYVRRTAGAGISYVLGNVYGRIYLDVIQRMCEAGILRSGFRVLEYGCGGGMNLLWIVSLLSRKGFPLESAYGTDFSPQMVDAANRDADAWAPPALRTRIAYFAGRNENLTEDLAAGLSKPRSELSNSFHLIAGVNTFRFCHRLGKAQECARDIHELLVPGGYSIMIDMNYSFPLFQSRLRDWLTKSPEQRLLPTLDEYARPFEETGLVIEDKRNFCWIPHSAGGLLLSLTRFLSPVLDGLLPRFAMRSLVVSRKPVWVDGSQRKEDAIRRMSHHGRQSPRPRI